MSHRPALELIAVERAAHISREGWTPEHDDKHANGDLARAASVYALNAASPIYRTDGDPWLWPWDRSWFKPTNRIRDLVKAGALIVAEIERLQRKDPNP